jgi:hypothetical protein
MKTDSDTIQEGAAWQQRLVTHLNKIGITGDSRWSQLANFNAEVQAKFKRSLPWNP